MIFYLNICLAFYNHPNITPTNFIKMTSSVFVSQFIANLHNLIKCKEKQQATLSSTGQKDSSEYKQIPFKLKYYRQWYNMLIAITDWPVSDVADSKLTKWFELIKGKYSMQESLITKMKEVQEHGTILELRDLLPKYPIAEPICTTQTIAEQLQVEEHEPTQPQSQTTGINVEAVPKKLALEGDRPDDSDPRGQKIYDMRLIHGFGEKNAAEYVDAGCTLEILLTDWDKFVTHPESQNGVIDKDYIPLSAGMDETKLNQTKVFVLKEEVLRTRLAKVSTWLPKLHHDQLVGIKYFKDTAQKIPREEIDKIQKYCQVVSKSLNPGFELMCCGSYRRGRPRSGDVDCLMTHVDLKTPDDIIEYENTNGSIIQAMVTLLKKLGFVSDYFTVGDTKFMGICKLPSNAKGTYSVYRHMDIRFVPYNSRGTAMLYFTGSFEYNKQMRYKANDKGYMLSEYGIYKYTKGENGKKVKGDQIDIPFHTEEAVCEWLGMPYLPPNERDI